MRARNAQSHHRQDIMFAENNTRVLIENEEVLWYENLYS
jgi:hypothetical protein